MSSNISSNWVHRKANLIFIYYIKHPYTFIGVDIAISEAVQRKDCLFHGLNCREERQGGGRLKVRVFFSLEGQACNDDARKKATLILDNMY
mgnify:CR=1 FL=1